MMEYQSHSEEQETRDFQNKVINLWEQSITA